MRMTVSVLYREPKVLKLLIVDAANRLPSVSVLYREPKVLKHVLLHAAR